MSNSDENAADIETPYIHMAECGVATEDPFYTKQMRHRRNRSTRAPRK